MMMYDRYNVELSNDYLNNTCTMGNRFGMFPTVEMIEEYNTINSRPSIIPTKETSQLRALFAEVIPSTDNNLFVLNRFKKLVGYRNILFPLSKRYPTLQEMSNELYNITNVHDIANYGKFARMLEVITQQNNIPVSFNRIEQWENEKTITPNETITTEGETNITNTSTDNTDTDGTTTRTTETDSTLSKTGTTATAKTGTDSTAGTDTNAKTGTETERNENSRELGGTDTTTTDGEKTISEEITNGITTFDNSSFNNDTNKQTQSTTEDDITVDVSYGQTISDDGTKTTTYNTTDTITKSGTVTYNTTDTTTHNTTDTTDTDTTETTVNDLTTERTSTNTGSSEKTETKTRTGENEETSNGHRYINTGLSMAELIERENVLLPVFDMYLLSIAREITLSSVEEIY